MWRQFASMGLGMAVLMAAPSILSAKELTFAGIELGKTSCSDAERRLRDAGAIIDQDRSRVNFGKLFELGAGAMGVQFIKSGVVICDLLNSHVEAIELTIPKSRAREVADALAKDYRQTKRRLPDLGSGEALFVSPTGESSGRIAYEHVSFEAIVQMSTRTFDEDLERDRRDQTERQQQEIEDAF